MYTTCALAIYTGGSTCACARDGNGRMSARATARACAFEAVQPHARPYPSPTQGVKFTYTYMYHAYIFINIHIYTHIYIHTSRLSYAQLYLRTGTAARARAYTLASTRARAHIGGAARTKRPASHQRPAERVPPAVARRPGRNGGAYPMQHGDRRGVPRADVRVKRRRPPERLRAERFAVHADGTRSHVSAQMRGRPIARAHARARTQHVDACVRRACIGDPFVRVARRAWIYIHASIMYLYTIRVRVPWMAVRSERAALAHMPRISSSSAPAIDRTRMQEDTRVPIDTPGLGIDTCIHVHDMCVVCIRMYPSIHIYMLYIHKTSALAIYTGGRTHART